MTKNELFSLAVLLFVIILSHPLGHFVSSHAQGDNMTGGAPAYVPDQGSSDGSSSGSSSSGSSSSGSGEGGGCLIATAAFGTELSPQVQFLRDFRDRDILSTFAGSSFMVAFNTWYYSFSPYVADYERQQPWFRDIVTVSLYPLLAVLYVSEKTYSFLEGETGAVVTGIITGLLLGALYSPILLVLSRKLVRFTINLRHIITVGVVLAISTIFSLVPINQFIMIICTSTLVLASIAISALVFSKLLNEFSERFVSHEVRS